MLKRPVFLGVTALAIALAVQATAQDVTADTVVASVGATDITLGHVIVLRESLPEQYQNLDDAVLFPGIVDQLVQQTILAQTVETASPAIELQLENERRSLMAGTALSQAMANAVTDESLNAAYEEQYASAAPSKEYNASHILVDTKEKAEELIAELSAGADFADLAKEHSTGPSGPNGGELGWFGEGMMVAPFQDAVFAMETGGISAPVETQFGWHVIKLNETRLLETPTLAEVQSELSQQIQEAAVEETLKNLTENADVTRPDLSKIDPSVIRNLELVQN